MGGVQAEADGLAFVHARIGIDPGDQAFLTNTDLRLVDLADELKRLHMSLYKVLGVAVIRIANRDEFRPQA